jgi:MFS family permease
MIAVYLLVGIGIAAGTVLPGALVLANWFTARRGMAMGIANAGSTTGGMVMTLVAGYAIRHWGWRAAYLTLGLPMLVIRFENPPGFKFCGQCSAPLSASETKTGPSIRIGEAAADTEIVEGERKTVTALFADIKGSTELMEDLDPEEARAIIDPALRLMIEAAHRYDGYVVQSTGDGIFALFGAPVAHEDHPQRA